MGRQSATTVHGEVTYETVECSSCGDEVAKEEAYEFKIGKDVDRTFSSRVERRGWACEYCSNEGPIRYPSGTLGQWARRWATILFWDTDLDMIHPIKTLLVAVLAIIGLPALYGVSVLLFETLTSLF